jgi:hypothetical protein
MSARRRIFLSSVFTDPGNQLRLPVRDRIIDMTGAEQPPTERPIWVAEDFSVLKPENTALLPLQKAMFCVEGVRSCDCFVAILSHRAGSDIPVDVDGGTTAEVPTSFFELELMAAALFGKPSFIYLHSGFKPSTKLAQFLDIMRPIFPDMALEYRTETQILRAVEKLVNRVERPWRPHLPMSIPRKRLFVDTLYRLRHRPYDVRREPPPIRFLDGHRDESVDEDRARAVPRLLELARSQQTYQDRLVMLWFAIHSLMGVPYTNPRYRDYLPLWEDALGNWNSSAAWFGLHGHGAIAGLAALGSLADARSTVASPSDPVHGIPHGPIASAYYKMAEKDDVLDQIGPLERLAHRFDRLRRR